MDGFKKGMRLRKEPPRERNVFLPGRVEDWNQVQRQMLGHAISLSLGDHKRKGQEHAPKETKARRHRDHKFDILQGPDEIHDIKWLFGVCDARFESRIGDGQHCKDHKGADPHRPGKSHLGDEIRDHDGKNDSAETGPRGGDAQGKGSSFGEPGADGVDAGVEDGTCAEGAADSLSQDELVVLGGEGSHHQAEDVEKGAPEENGTGTVVVEESTEDGALRDSGQ